MSLFRVAPFAFGIVLIVVGFSNILVGIDKVAQYEDLIVERAAHAPPARLAAATGLDPRQTLGLLQPLRQGSGGDLGAAGKLSFYRVVATGGWVVAVIGLLSAMVGVVQHRRTARLIRESRSY